MSRSRIVVPALLAAAALALAGCASSPAGDSPAEPAASSSTDAAADATADPTADEGAETSPSDAASDGADEPETTEGQDADDDLPASDTDPDGGAGPDDDQVSFPATDSVLAPECAVVPGPPIEHTIVSMDVVEIEGGFECTTEIDSRGDSLHLADEIAAQLDAAGHVQTSRAPGDDSIDAVNVMSYLIGTDELHVTVRQNGATGVIIHYFLAPARGNG